MWGMHMLIICVWTLHGFLHNPWSRFNHQFNLYARDVQLWPNVIWTSEQRHHSLVPLIKSTGMVLLLCWICWIISNIATSLIKSRETEFSLRRQCTGIVHTQAMLRLTITVRKYTDTLLERDASCAFQVMQDQWNHHVLCSILQVSLGNTTDPYMPWFVLQVVHFAQIKSNGENLVGLRSQVLIVITLWSCKVWLSYATGHEWSSGKLCEALFILDVSTHCGRNVQERMVAQCRAWFLEFLWPV